MSIVLFALIGASIKAGVAYWICFGLFCAFKLFDAVYKTVKEYVNK